MSEICDEATWGS